MCFPTGVGNRNVSGPQARQIVAGNPCRIDRLYGNLSSGVFRTAISVQSDFLFRCYSDPKRYAVPVPVMGTRRVSGFAASVFGSVMVSTPLSKAAVILSGSTVSGSRKLRPMVP